MTLYLPQRRLIVSERPRLFTFEVDWDAVLRKMLSLVVPNASLQTEQKIGLKVVSQSDLTLKLYTSNTTPGSSDTAGTFTEMSTQGYAAISITAGSWSVTSANPSVASYGQQTWTFDGSGGSTSVYGYFLVNTTGGLLRWVERFSDGPYVIVNNGDAIKLTLARNLAN